MYMYIYKFIYIYIYIYKLVYVSDLSLVGRSAARLNKRSTSPRIASDFYS